MIIKGITKKTEEKIEVLEKMEIDDLSNRKTQKLNEIFNHPFLILKFHNVKMKSEISEYLFIPSKEKTEFWFGRSSITDITIPSQTISRKQNKVSFENGSWKISDGDGTKESANGSWLGVADELQMSTREGESDPKEISNGDIIRISDSILKVLIFSNKSLNFKT